MNKYRDGLFYRVDLNLLKTFFFIVENRSFSKAAADLGISQPSVSAALCRLEEALGSQLIVRSTHRFDITDHGLQLYQECCEIFARMIRLEKSLQENRRIITGTVHISAVTGITHPFLEQALQRTHHLYPEVSFQTEIASSQDVIRAVSQQVVPVGFCLMPSPLAGLDCHLIEREEFAMYCGSGHSLFGASEITFERLGKEKFVSFSCAVGEGALEPMLAMGAGHRFALNVAASSMNLTEVKRFILAGIGVGILPRNAARKELSEGRLAELSLRETQLTANLYCISNPHMPHQRAEHAFLEVIRELVATDGGIS